MIALIKALGRIIATTNTTTKTPKPKTSHHETKRSIKRNNSTNKRFLRSKSSVNRVLCKHLSSRCINVQVANLCNEARITTSTFYAHYKDSDHALKVLEDDLEREFDLRLPQNTTRDTFFDILTMFIHRNRQYFEATCSASNHYLLTKIFARHRLLLTGKRISNRSFLSYTGALIVILTCWIKLDQLTSSSTTTCSKKLSHVPIITDERWL